MTAQNECNLKGTFNAWVIYRIIIISRKERTTYRVFINERNHNNQETLYG